MKNEVSPCSIKKKRSKLKEVTLTIDGSVAAGYCAESNHFFSGLYSISLSPHLLLYW